MLGDDFTLPFFITYDEDPAARRNRWQQDARNASTTGFGTFVELGGDPARIHEWLGDSDLPIRITTGRPGLHNVGIAGPTAEIVLEDNA